MSAPAKSSSPHAFWVILSLIGVQACFGANYVISKVVVANFPPLVWASFRIFVSTAVMWTICLAMRRPAPKREKSFLVPLVGLALMGTILNQVSFLVGLSLTTATNAAVLNTLIPVATLAVVTIRGQEKLTWAKGIGFLLAFAGVLAIRRIENIRFSDATFVGDLLNIFNCILYGCFLSYGRPFMQKHDALWVTAYLFLYGTVGIGLIALPAWLKFQMPEMTNQLLWSSVFAIVFGTLVPYFLNFWALKHANSSQVALFIYLQPVIAAFIAWKFFDESITDRTWISTAFIFLGMVAVILGSRRAKASEMRRVE